jgi:hypothetical protein
MRLLKRRLIGPLELMTGYRFLLVVIDLLRSIPVNDRSRLPCRESNGVSSGLVNFTYTRPPQQISSGLCLVARIPH